MKDVLLKKLIMICKKYIGEEETNEIINDTIEEFKKECVKNSKEYYRDNARKPKELKK